MEQLTDKVVRYRLASLLGVAFLLLVSLAYSVEFRSDENIVIAADEVIEDDIYVAAATVTLDGTVLGDIVTAGRHITINGKVEGDVIAAGQTITINGEVTDDVRITGAALTLGPEAIIGDDVISSGYSLETKAGSTVGGTLNFGGGQALLAGDVAEDANVGTNGLELRGTISGNLKAEVGDESKTPSFRPNESIPGMPDVPTVAGGLTLGDEARVEGDLNIRSIGSIEIPPEAVGGEIAIEKRDVIIVNQMRSRLWTSLQRCLALVIVGLLLFWLAPNLVKRPAEQLADKPWASLGLGTLTLIGFPIAIAVFIGLVIALAVVLAAITLGNLGANLGFLGAVAVLISGTIFGLVLGYLTQIIVAYLGGRWLLSRKTPEATVNPFWALLIGALIVVALTALPILGPIITLIIIIFGLGALWLSRSKNSTSQGEPASI